MRGVILRFVLTGALLAGAGLSIAATGPNSYSTLPPHTCWANPNGFADSPRPTACGVLFQTALPFVIAPTGTIANNGAVTLGTALPATYGPTYTYFPANAISSGSAAGWYYTNYSSTTVGTVFNNTYTSGQPLIPGTPTAFATTGPGAYTGVTTEQAAQTYSLPGGTLGVRDGLRITALFSMPANTDTKTMRVGANGPGGTNFWTYGQVGSTIKTQGVAVTATNRESQSSQLGCVGGAANVNGCLGTGTQGFSTTALNTGATQTIGPTLQLGTATDYLICEAVTVEMLKGN